MCYAKFQNRFHVHVLSWDERIGTLQRALFTRPPYRLERLKKALFYHRRPRSE